MSTADLTALHTVTLVAISEKARIARTHPNITRWAETLFNDGYTVERRRIAGLFYVTGPQGQEYQVNTDTALGNCCDCPAFAEYETCKHYETIDRMLNVDGFNNSLVSFDAHDVFADFRGLFVWYGQNVTLDLTGTPAAVPEAFTTVSLGLLLVFGLGGIVLRGIRKRM